MTQHDHDKQHHHGHHNPGHKQRSIHKDWRAWAVVGLMLAGMLIYVLSDNESIQPGSESGQGMPIDSPPVEAAP